MYQNVFPGAVDSTGTTVSISAYNNRNDRDNLFNQTDLTWRAPPARVNHTLLAGLELGRQVSRQPPQHRLLRQRRDHGDRAARRVRRSAVPITFRPSETDADNRVRATLGGGVPAGPGDADPVPPAHRRRPARAVRPRLPQQPERRRPRAHRRPALAPRGRGGEAGRAALALRQLQRVVPAQLGRPVQLAHRDHRDAGAGEVRELRAGRQVRRGERASRSPAAVYQLDRTNTTRPRPGGPLAHRADRQPAHPGVRGGRHRQCDPRVAGRGGLRAAGCGDHRPHGAGGARREGAGGSGEHAVAVEPLPAPPAVGRRSGRHLSGRHVRRRSTTRSPCRASPGSTRACSSP